MSKFLNFLKFYASCLCQIRLISWIKYFRTDKNTYNILGWVLLQLFEPFGDILKSGSSCKIKNNKSAWSSFIISVSYGSESFLTGCIPNLNFDFMVLESNSFSCELNSNSWLRLYTKLILLKSRQKIGLTHTRIWIYWQLPPITTILSNKSYD